MLEQEKPPNDIKPAAVANAEGAAASQIAKLGNKTGLKTAVDEDYPPVATPACGAEYQGGPTETTCPAECEYAAEMDTTTDPTQQCHFKCVTKMDCGSKGTQPTYTIADEGMKLCRHCDVEGCLTCEPGPPGADIEKCTQCMPGY